jgi:hypothetical protein
MYVSGSLLGKEGEFIIQGGNKVRRQLNILKNNVDLATILGTKLQGIKLYFNTY